MKEKRTSREQPAGSGEVPCRESGPRRSDMDKLELWEKICAFVDAGEDIPDDLLALAEEIDPLLGDDNALKVRNELLH